LSTDCLTTSTSSPPSRAKRGPVVRFSRCNPQHGIGVEGTMVAFGCELHNAEARCARHLKPSAHFMDYDALKELIRNADDAFFERLERELLLVRASIEEMGRHGGGRETACECTLPCNSSWALVCAMSRTPHDARYNTEAGRLAQREFVRVNRTGFRKILKKWDKVRGWAERTDPATCRRPRCARAERPRCAGAALTKSAPPPPLTVHPHRLTRACHSRRTTRPPPPPRHSSSSSSSSSSSRASERRRRSPSGAGRRAARTCSR